MKRWQIVTMFLICTVLACAGVWYFEHNSEEKEEQRAATQRQHIYESILHSYSAALTNGMTRDQVEDYLRKRGVEFDDICCLAQSDPYAEITKIGYERGPWYCDGYEVYIGFEFRGLPASEEAVDTLKKVSLVSLPDNCL